MTIQQNDLVYHTKQRGLGIGCVARIYKTYHKVNFGTDKSMKVPSWFLEKIDTSQCKTMTVAEMGQGIADRTIDYLIIGNELRKSNGEKFETVRAVTEEDLKNYKRLIV